MAFGPGRVAISAQARKRGGSVRDAYHPGARHEHPQMPERYRMEGRQLQDNFHDQPLRRPTTVQPMTPQAERGGGGPRRGAYGATPGPTPEEPQKETKKWKRNVGKALFGIFGADENFLRARETRRKEEREQKTEAEKIRQQGIENSRDAAWKALDSTLLDPEDPQYENWKRAIDSEYQDKEEAANLASVRGGIIPMDMPPEQQEYYRGQLEEKQARGRAGAAGGDWAPGVTAGTVDDALRAGVNPGKPGTETHAFFAQVLTGMMGAKNEKERLRLQKLWGEAVMFAEKSKDQWAMGTPEEQERAKLQRAYDLYKDIIGGPQDPRRAQFEEMWLAVKNDPAFEGAPDSVIKREVIRRLEEQSQGQGQDVTRMP